MQIQLSALPTSTNLHQFFLYDITFDFENIYVKPSSHSASEQ